MTKRIEFPCFVQAQEGHPSQIGRKASDKVVDMFKDFLADRFGRVDQSRVDWQKIFGDLCRCQDLGQFVEVRSDGTEYPIASSVLESLEETSNFGPSIRAKSEAYTGKLKSVIARCH